MVGIIGREVGINMYNACELTDGWENPGADFSGVTLRALRGTPRREEAP